MADPLNPWTEDFAALGEVTRSQLRPRTALSTIPIQETKMRLFKQRPILATFVALAVLALAAPIAYAIGGRLSLTIDPAKSASEIEQDIQSQLQNAGVQATVHADKADNRVELQIQSEDEALGSALAFTVPGGGAAGSAQRGMMRLEDHCVLDDAQRQRLTEAATSPGMLPLLYNRPADETDDQLAKAVTAEFAKLGWTVEVKVEAGGLTVVVKAPPAS